MYRYFLAFVLILSISAGGNEVKPGLYTAEGKELLAGASKDLVVTSSCPDAIGKPGETVSFKIVPAAPPAKAEYIRVFKFLNGLEVARTDLPVQETVVTMSSDAPAHLMVTALYLSSKKRVLNPPSRITANGDGVYIEPEKLAVARPKPADFDAFWTKQLQQLAEVPMQVSRTEIDRSPVWKCEDVEITSIADIPVKGYLVTPLRSAPKSLPAIIYFHGAGFKSSTKQTRFGGRAIVFDVNAHGVPNGMSDEYYRNLNRGGAPADRNIRIGKDDPEKNYFKNMFLRTVRALDFIKSLPEWDGKTLIVFGRSQGGAQSLAAAALVPEVTLCVANVPALTDHGGVMVKRKPGWPQYNTRRQKKVAQTADYIDVINLAGRIKCEVIMSVGMIDPICPPIGVYLTYKSIPHNNKKITLFPRLGHNAPPKDADGTARVTKELKK